MTSDNLRRGLVEPMYYPQSGRFWCVHKWAMVRTDYRLDTYCCMKCGAESVNDIGAPPNFTNFLLPFILIIGTIGGFIFASSRGEILAVVICSASLIGSIIWIWAALKNTQIDGRHVELVVVSKNWLPGREKP